MDIYDVQRRYTNKAVETLKNIYGVSESFLLRQALESSQLEFESRVLNDRYFINDKEIGTKIIRHADTKAPAVLYGGAAVAWLIHDLVGLKPGKQYVGRYTHMYWEQSAYGRADLYVLREDQQLSSLLYPRTHYVTSKLEINEKISSSFTREFLITFNGFDYSDFDTITSTWITLSDKASYHEFMPADTEVLSAGYPEDKDKLRNEHIQMIARGTGIDLLMLNTEVSRFIKAIDLDICQVFIVITKDKAVAFYTRDFGRALNDMKVHVRGVPSLGDSVTESRREKYQSRLDNLFTIKSL